MKRRARLPLKKVTLNVFEEDWEKLGVFHPTLGPSNVVRELIHSHVLRIEQRQAQVGTLSEAELDKLV